VGSRQAKDALFDGLTSVARALGNGRRAEIVDVLTQGERRVEDLAGEIGQTVANTSQHLQVLLRAGLVQSRREGTRVFYSVASDDVLRLWQGMREVARAHVTELDRLTTAYLGDRSELSPMSRDELLAHLDAGDVVLVDVRPAAEFRAGHIPAARSVPLDELVDRLPELPADAEIVAYCRGQYCAFAPDAVRLLRSHGRRAVPLVDGMLEWRLAGLPVAS
jgi:rhodanese-related sulfurtransferase/predicted transcriptional regulator